MVIIIMYFLQIVNCHYEEVSESHFKVKYESSKHKGMNSYCVLYTSYFHLSIGKNVFKKSIKLTISVVPTQTNQNSLHQATLGSESDTVGGGASDTGEAITFDGKTFTVTFSQNSGTLK